MTKDILFVFGTRPEAIKLAPVIKALRESTKLNSIVCVTGQHKEMLEQMLDIFEISPHYDLEAMEEDQSLAGLSSRLIEKLDSVMKDRKPHMTVVQGDTTSCFVGGLVSYYHRIPVAHVEAGLRSGDKFDPFPEEINRSLTDSLTDLYFAPTERNKKNLYREGVVKDKIHVTGNTVIDTLFDTTSLIEDGKIKIDLPAELKSKNLQDIILVTAHRRESFGKGLKNICEALKRLAELHPSYHIIYPVHLNPNVRSKVNSTLRNLENVILTDPLGYREFVWVMNRAKLVLTDSGGIQEEAPSLETPVLVMRKKTERKEALEAGTIELVGVSSDRIVDRAVEYLSNSDLRRKMSKKVNPYGDGKASDRIIRELTNFLYEY